MVWELTIERRVYVTKIRSSPLIRAKGTQSYNILILCRKTKTRSVSTDGNTVASVRLDWWSQLWPASWAGCTTKRPSSRSSSTTRVRATTLTRMEPRTTSKASRYLNITITNLFNKVTLGRSKALNLTPSKAKTLLKVQPYFLFMMLKNCSDFLVKWTLFN